MHTEDPRNLSQENHTKNDASFLVSPLISRTVDPMTSDLDPATPTDTTIIDNVSAKNIQSDPVTTNPDYANIVTPDPVTSDHGYANNVTSDPLTTDPDYADSVTSDPVTLDHGYANNVTSDPLTSDPEPPANARPVPPDGGYGWFVVAGCFLMHAVVGGYSRSYSLVYIQLRRKFGSSAAVTAWVGGAASSLRFALAPVATALSTRFGVRPIVITGGLLMSSGAILSAWTPSTQFMFFSYSLLAGGMSSLCFAPGLVLVGKYFDRRRSVAMGLSTCGSGLGVFLFPFLMEMLFETYTYSGAMLILGGLCLNNVVSGALYRPLETPRRINLHKDIYSDQKVSLIKSIDGSSKPDDKICSNISAVSQSPASNKNILPTSADNQKTGSRPKDLSNVPGLKNPPVEQISATCCSGRCCHINRYLDFRLWRHPTFTCYCITMGFHGLTYISAQMLLPDHGLDCGLTPSQSVRLLSTVGLSDTVGRVLCGLIFGISCVRPLRRAAYIISILVVAMTCYLFAVVTSFPALLITCMIHGLFNGAVVSQIVVILSDILGPENLSSAFGFLIFTKGMGVLIGPLMAGALKDYTGLYSASFCLLGTTGTIAASIMFLEHLYSRCNPRKPWPVIDTGPTAAV